MTTLIHVNQGNIRSNKHREEGNKLPVLRAQWDSNTRALYGDSIHILDEDCLLYTSPSPRDATLSRMPSSA